MAEEFLRQEERGAAFAVAPSGSGLPSQHKALAKNMYENLFYKNMTVGGVLLTYSKIAAYQQTFAQDILETFIFFGDPALELKALPEGYIGFRALEPQDNARLTVDYIRAFRWNMGPYSKFKIQFSPTEDFNHKKTFYFPRKKKRFFSGDMYLPSPTKWLKLIRKSRKFKRISGQRGLLYWRVVAYDENDSSVLDYSNYHSLNFN
jgi:hypothetical protein